MTVNEIIELLDKEENKYGGATGKERELNLSVNGDFIGTITSAKLDGWGDGLVTDVTLEVEVDSIKYHDEKVRNKAINEFAERLKAILKDMQILSLQGEDDCPHDVCPHGNQSITCEYCIREQTIKDIERIAEGMRGAE